MKDKINKQFLNDIKSMKYIEPLWGSARKTWKTYVKTVITKNIFYQNILT
ncbi:hypothetical protein Ctaglu_48650 [Clostridium tagluense]|uniref:Uncharacterized protein n=1 Tax=Clostridium tagluense TaxID=360422 RepID=A0A401UUK9_9CLOT|nr:hypothetical protein Ctaglu_48650 [Clostridium tagluense]